MSFGLPLFQEGVERTLVNEQVGDPFLEDSELSITAQVAAILCPIDSSHPHPLHIHETDFREPFMHLFLTLLLAHLFADFPLQSNALIRFKNNHLGGVLLHALIYTIVTAILIDRWTSYWPLIIGLGTVHFAIDTIKSHLSTGTEEIHIFLLDQTIHLVTMFIATLLAHSLWHVVPVGIVPEHWLPVVLFAAFLPAFMVGYWVWATSSGCGCVKGSVWLRQFYGSILVVEQRFGLVVLVIIFWAFVR